tara:strand:- start:16384 stop:17373 length:990 start_codon:yes stop_codon:yes gene_type:complete
MLTYQQLEKIPKIDTHVNLRMDKFARETVTGPDGIYSLVHQYAEQATKNNVVLAELVYTPEFYTVPMKDGLTAVTNAIKECSNNNLRLNLSIQFIRDEEQKKALERFDILSDWFKWNRKLEHIITGITIGSFWNHQDITTYETFINRTKELPNLALNFNMELSPRSYRDLLKFYNMLSQMNQRCNKIIINGFGTNAYEDDLFRNKSFTDALFSDNKSLVISPRKTDTNTVELEKQIERIYNWVNEGKRIIINTDDHFRETNKYGHFNTILEKAFVLYEKKYWSRNGYENWNKDHIVTFMRNAQTQSRNIEYDSNKLSHKYINILNDNNF